MVKVYFMAKPKDKRMNVASFFKQFREERGLSQRELAKLVDRDQSYIAQVELGRFKKMPLDLIKKIHNDLLSDEERDVLMDLLFLEISEYIEESN